VGQIGSRSRQDGFQVLENAGCLFGDGASDDLAGCRIERDLA
jgi:hypothetical protein